jgi:chemotaxis protein methyltransferase CheR
MDARPSSVSIATLAQAARVVAMRTGLDLRSKQHDLPHLLTTAAAAHALSVEVWLDRLQDATESDPLWTTLFEALTIGETYFMRDAQHFSILQQHILPAYHQARHLNVWSAGCASGEEAYSIAITLGQSLPELAKWQINLHGTDINANAIQRAQMGVYRPWSFRFSDLAWQARYFTPIHTPATAASTLGERWRIVDAVRGMVRWRCANLFAPPPALGLDVIFCRNVLIYLDEEHIAQIEDVFFDALAPRGWLILGAAEALHVRRERWQTHVFEGAVLYQKPERAPLPTSFHHILSAPPTPQPSPIAQSAADALPHTGTTQAPLAQLPDAQYMTALLAFQSDHVGEAERLLGAMLSEQPDYVAGQVLLAALFANRHAFAEAHHHLDVALQAAPMAADAYFVRALAYLGQDDDTPASAERIHTALTAALYCAADHVLAAFTLANLYAKQGNLARARKFWQRAHTAACRLPATAYVCDVSEMTAGQVLTLIEPYLNS